MRNKRWSGKNELRTGILTVGSKLKNTKINGHFEDNPGHGDCGRTQFSVTISGGDFGATGVEHLLLMYDVFMWRYASVQCVI